MKIEELLSKLVTVYHKRKEILKNKELDIPGIGKFTSDYGNVSNDGKNNNVIIIKKVSRTKYQEPSFYMFLPKNYSLSIKRKKNGEHIFTRINKKLVNLNVPTESDEYFNFSLENDISLSFDDLQLVLKAFKQINHTVAIRLWD